MTLSFNIKEIKPRIFLFEFVNSYDMCMHFLRYQEFYESPSDNFRNKPFEILDFMRWYSFEYGGGAFTYPIDWDGFNFPSQIIPTVNNLGITDLNKYDKAMSEAWDICHKLSKQQPFYIIGTLKDSDALDHELAHAFYTIHSEYKEHMTKLVEVLDPSMKQEIFSILESIGYALEVHMDEAQAYLATGLNAAFSDLDRWETQRKPFIDYFDKFSALI